VLLANFRQTFADGSDEIADIGRYDCIVSDKSRNDVSRQSRQGRLLLLILLRLIDVFRHRYGLSCFFQLTG
jgi:hypothetical protein